jgi:hypothetical protein
MDEGAPLVRYFALVDASGELSAAYGIFREIQTKDRYSLQRLDSKDPDRWVSDPSLVEYTIRGEPGALEITEDQARRLVERLGGRLSTGIEFPS